MQFGRCVVWRACPLLNAPALVMQQASSARRRSARRPSVFPAPVAKCVSCNDTVDGVAAVPDGARLAAPINARQQLAVDSPPDLCRACLSHPNTDTQVCADARGASHPQHAAPRRASSLEGVHHELVGACAGGPGGAERQAAAERPGRNAGAQLLVLTTS
eukprot:350428-Chlamydomonas_euryale.AAC.6